MNTIQSSQLPPNMNHEGKKLDINNLEVLHPFQEKIEKVVGQFDLYSAFELDRSPLDEAEKTHILGYGICVAVRIVLKDGGEFSISQAMKNTYSLDFQSLNTYGFELMYRDADGLLDDKTQIKSQDISEALTMAFNHLENTKN